MKVGEQDRASEKWVFDLEGLLDLQDQITRPRLAHRRDFGAGVIIVIVVEPRPATCGPLHQHLVAGLDEVGSTCKRQRDPVLLILDLRDDSDLHGSPSAARAPSHPSRLERHDLDQDLSAGDAARDQGLSPH